MNYLFYDTQGNVNLTYPETNKPSQELIDQFDGRVVEYVGELYKEGHSSKITVDLKTREVTVTFTKLEPSNEDKRVEELEINVEELADGQSELLLMATDLLFE